MKNLTRVTHSYTTIIPASPEAVFPLLCPVREYDWIPTWKCELIFSESGFAELGCVFTTESPEPFGTETWTISHYEPNRRISFVRTGKKRTTRYVIMLTEKANGCEITWKQEITALTTDVESAVTNYSKEDFYALMKPLNKILAHYVTTGKMLLHDK